MNCLVCYTTIQWFRIHKHEQQLVMVSESGIKCGGASVPEIVPRCSVSSDFSLWSNQFLLRLFLALFPLVSSVFFPSLPLSPFPKVREPCWEDKRLNNYEFSHEWPEQAIHPPFFICSSSPLEHWEQTNYIFHLHSAHHSQSWKLKINRLGGVCVINNGNPMLKEDL